MYSARSNFDMNASLFKLKDFNCYLIDKKGDVINSVPKKEWKYGGNLFQEYLSKLYVHSEV